MSLDIMILNRYKCDILYLFFYAKILAKGGMDMFSDEVIEKIYSNSKINSIPVQQASEFIKIFQEVFEEIKEERPYATISELFNE